MRVTVATCVYNEELLAEELVRRVTAVLDGLPGGAHEFVIVDDGSRDRTLALLEAAAARDPRLVVVAFSRNFGHQAALTAGLDHATGDVVILMDGDLQDPPELIPAFLAKHAEGFDVVYAVRSERQESWHLRLAYRLFYRLANAMASLPLPLDAGDFGLMSRRAVDAMRSSPERQRYLRGLRAWVGFRQAALPVPRAARHAGEPKYGASKLLRLAFDGLFAFSIAPIRAATVLGAFAIVGSLLFALYALYVRLVLDRAPVGFTALLFVSIFAFGTLLLFLGLIGEYVGRIYEEVKARPLYVVDRVIRGR